MIEWNDVNFKMPETYKPVICKGKLDGKDQIFAGWWDNVKNQKDWYCFPMSWCSCCHQPETIVEFWISYPE